MDCSADVVAMMRKPVADDVDCGFGCWMHQSYYPLALRYCLVSQSAWGYMVECRLRNLRSA